jgi:hypothetical protein
VPVVVDILANRRSTDRRKSSRESALV